MHLQLTGPHPPSSLLSAIPLVALGVHEPNCALENLVSARHMPPRRHNTAPSRLRKRDIPAAWDLFALDERVSETASFDEDASSQASAPSLSRGLSHSSFGDSEATELAYPAFDPSERKTDGGSWPRYRKQRTPQGSMSLFEVAEALGSHQEGHGDDEHDVSKQLNKLASLVAAEKDELATLTASEATSNDSIESFVDAVFDGITPAEQYRPEVSAPSHSSSCSSTISYMSSSSSSTVTVRAGPAEGSHALSKDGGRTASGMPPFQTANDLALLEAMRADEEAESARRRAMQSSPTLTAVADDLPDAPPLAGEDDDVFAMLSSLDVPPAVHASYPSASHYLPLELPPPSADEHYAAELALHPEHFPSHHFQHGAYPILPPAHHQATPYPPADHYAAYAPAGAPPAHGAPPRNDYPLSPTAADSLAGQFDLALGQAFDASPKPSAAANVSRSRSRGVGGSASSHRRGGSGSRHRPPAPIPLRLHRPGTASQADVGDAEATALPAGDHASVATPPCAIQHPPGGGEAAAAGSGGGKSGGGGGGVGPPIAGGGSNRNGAERKEWSVQEDAIIRQAVLAHGGRWRKIAAELPGRSDDAVRNRWNRLKEMGIGSEAAATQSDSADGAPSAAAGSGAAASAAAIQSADALVGNAAANAAAPAVLASAKRSEPKEKPERISWSRAEDDTILSGVSELGHKWNKIAERLPGRTDHAIRNRFHRLQTLLQDRQRQEQRTLAPTAPLPLGLQGAGASSDALLPSSSGGESNSTCGFPTPRESPSSTAMQTH